MPDAVGSDFRHEVPAACAFVAGGGEDFDLQIGSFEDVDGGDIEKFLEAGGVALKECE